jgi:hypothetical protein
MLVRWNTKGNDESTSDNHLNPPLRRTLKDKLFLLALDGNKSLVAVQVGSILGNEALNPGRQELQVDIAFQLHGRRDDGAIVLVFGIGIVQEFGLKVQNALQVERSLIEKFLGRNIPLCGAQDLSSRIERSKTAFNLGGLLFLLGRVAFRLNQVDLVEDDLVGKDHLFYSLGAVGSQ